MAPRSEDPQLITRVISFELSNTHAHGTSTLQTDGRTDRQMDGRLTIAISHSALRALHDKKTFIGLILTTG